MKEILKLLVRKLGSYKLRKEVEYAFQCPKCVDDEKRLDVNLRRGKFYCYHCGFRGNINNLLKFLDIKISSLGKEGTREFRKEKDKVVPLIPKNLSPLNTCQLLYLKHRGLNLNPQGLRHTNWEWCDYNGRIYIPILEDWKVVCWIARAIDDSKPKDICPKSNVSNKSHYLYNIDQLEEGDEVLLVEGVFDTEHLRELGFKSVAVMGSHISDIQIGKLLSKKPSVVYIMFDGDDAGKEGAMDSYFKLIHRYDMNRIRVVGTPEGKDPDDLNREEILRLIGRGRI
jgi:DNA primase